MEGKVVGAEGRSLERWGSVVGMGEGEEILPTAEGLAGNGGELEGLVFHEVESAADAGQDGGHLFFGKLHWGAVAKDGLVLINQVVVGLAENFVEAVLPVLLEAGQHLGKKLEVKQVEDE